MSEFSQREQVLQAIRGLAAYGLGPNIGGHVSVRVPGKPEFYINAFDKTFEEMQLRDIALLDFDGKVIECETHVSPGLTFHHGIYKQRPDVNAIVHTHGFWLTAQSAFGRPVRTLHNLTTYFHGRTCIIPWHGAITIGKNIGDAAALHVTLDYAARLDVTMPATAPEMPETLREELASVLRRANYLDLTWNLIRRKGVDAYDGKRVIPGLAN
jgi:L-fuculose-phosphate aldolase